MIQIKKTILTLVALLAVTTGAWAQGKLIYEKDFASDASYPFYLDAADKTGASAKVTAGLLVLTNPKVQANNWDVQPEIGRLTSAAPITKGNTYRVVMQYKTTVAGSVTFALGSQQDWNNADWRGQTITISDEFQTCEAYFNNYPYSIAESHILLQFGELVGTITIKKVEVYELYPFPIAWNGATKTGKFTMPAGNVTVSVEYYPQATLAFQGLTAAEDAAAKTEAPLAVLADGAVTGGTLMYYVAPDENFSQADAIALAETQWSAAIPTAETIEAAGTYIMWYYIKGDAEHSDTDPVPLVVTLLPEPTYAVTFAEGTDPNEWTASPNAGVKKGETVTVTYNGSKKVIGVKAEKKAAGVKVTAITLNKTATTITAGQTETLSVSSVTPDNATDQTVTWSSDNEAVATVDADGKVTAVALGTANITATANDGSGVTATCAVTVSKVVTINQSDWGSDWNPSFTKDGVTVSAGMIDTRDGNLMEGGTFSTTLGNFTKIVVTAAHCAASGTGWSGSRSSMTWTGTPASTVSFSGEFMGMGMTQTTIVCTIVPTN